MTSLLERLPILILFPHNRCNCRCVMCDIWKDPGSREISAAELERHAAGIRALGVEWVVFSGGEPLMHSDLFRLCAILRGLGVRITILSSGLLLARWAGQIVAHADEVIVSLDGPPQVHDQIRRVTGAFDCLSAGVRALHRFDAAFPVAARCTVQKLNHTKLCDTVDAASAAGLQFISFLAADLRSSAFNRPGGWSDRRRFEIALTASEADALEEEVERLICRADALNPGFVRESPVKLRRIVHHFRAELGLAPHVAPACNAPWVSAVVETDGTVRPCFFHEPIGTIKDSTLATVLNSPAAVRFRESLDVATSPVCRQCVCSLYRP